MSRKKPGLYDTLWRLALALPEVEEGTSYGTPAFKVKGKLIARLKEDGESLVILIDFEEREHLLKADPATFYITDHYRNYPSVLVRLPKVRATALRDLLEKAWRRAAPRTVVEAFDGKDDKRVTGLGSKGIPAKAPRRRARSSRGRG
ncbi:MAG TPA: MmcQ/YjbR family DNA-binding protein [Vicinamibacteria bacterium]|nr:MmcQ/YjbR family DNA-binding protein [Vicinamibacteria bacterium]